MSNSPLVVYTKISPNKNSPRTAKIDTISIHCTAGQCTAEALGNVFAPTSRQASSNYGVDKDGRIGMYVEEKDRSWCTSSSSNDNRAITIEVSSDAKHPYTVSDKALAALIELCADICKRNDIKQLLWKGDKSLIGQADKQNMTVHRWFAAKACPGDYLYERHGYIANEVNKKLLEMEDDDMTIERFTELMNEYRNSLRDNDCAAWSEEARNWNVEKGLIAGGGVGVDGKTNYMWEDLLTREQAAQLFYRFAQLMGKA